MKRIRVSSSANAAEDNDVLFSGSVHSRAMQHGQCQAQINSIVLPQQFRNSSADMWVAVTSLGSEVYEVSTPVKSSHAIGTTGSSITFMENANGDKINWIWQPSAAIPHYRLESTKNLSRAHTKIRPSKWTSEVEAYNSINSALRCSQINRFVGSANVMEKQQAELIPLYATGSGSNISISYNTHSLELYLYSTHVQTREIILRFESFHPTIDNVDWVVNLGTFSFEANKMYRLTPYDVNEHIAGTTSSMSPEQAREVAADYHGTEEKAREYFLRQRVDLVASKTLRRDLWQNVTYDNTGFQGNILIGKYSYSSNNYTNLSDTYLYELPSIESFISPNGPLLMLRQDVKDPIIIEMSDAMKYRLQLSEESTIVDSQRREGDLNASGNIVKKDAIKIVIGRQSKFAPIFNDVYDVSIQKGDESGRVHVKQGKSARLANDIAHFHPQLTTLPYPEANVISADTDIDMGDNNLDQNGFITLHNTLTGQDETLPIKNKLKGLCNATIDMDLLSAEG